MSEVKTVSKDKEKKRPAVEGEKDEYTDKLAEIKAVYNNTVVNARNVFDNKCKEYIAALTAILEKYLDVDGSKMSVLDIRNKIRKDVAEFWAKAWIERNFPPQLAIRDENVNENAGAGGQSTQTVTKTGEPEDPIKAENKELKNELKLKKEEVTTLQKLQEKNNKRMSQMTTQIEELQEFKKSAGSVQKSVAKLKDVYNPKLESVEVIISGPSIQRLEQFIKSPHALTDRVKLVIKIGENGQGVIDSIKRN